MTGSGLSSIVWERVIDVHKYWLDQDHSQPITLHVTLHVTGLEYNTQQPDYSYFRKRRRKKEADYWLYYSEAYLKRKRHLDCAMLVEFKILNNGWYWE